MKSPKSIVITGASSGLGQALAIELAKPGRRILLAGRDEVRLEDTRAAVTAKGAKAEICTVPVTERHAFRDALIAFDAANPVDLLIANAGVKTGNRDGVEPADQLERVVRVNLIGAMDTVQALLPAMRARGRGQIALLGSLATVSPHADLLSYSATKAGITAYATALRRNLIGSGLRVSLIVPGFVLTPMTERHGGPAPMALSPQTAARIVVRRLARGERTIAFPRTLFLLTRLSWMLPGPISDRIENLFRAEIAPDPDERKSSEL